MADGLRLPPVDEMLARFMKRRLPLLLLTALAASTTACRGAVALSPDKPGVVRTVRYRFYARETGARARAAETPPCNELVLEERVLNVEGDRELEIEVAIVGGDQPSCNVGRRVVARGDGDRGMVLVPAGPPLDPPIEMRLRTLHARLGRPSGAFSVSNGAIPLDAPRRDLTEGGIAYEDLYADERVTFAAKSAIQGNE